MISPFYLTIPSYAINGALMSHIRNLDPIWLLFSPKNKQGQAIVKLLRSAAFTNLPQKILRVLEEVNDCYLLRPKVVKKYRRHRNLTSLGRMPRNTTDLV